jgi:hypothetical protein
MVVGLEGGEGRWFRLVSGWMHVESCSLLLLLLQAGRVWRVYVWGSGLKVGITEPTCVGSSSSSPICTYVLLVLLVAAILYSSTYVAEPSCFMHGQVRIER